MSTFKCKMCGGTLEIQNGSTVAECEYCGAKQTLPKLDDEKRVNLYDRANHFRRSNEFDKASAIYEQILNEDNTDAEAYWSLVLCRYGIEYVEDPVSHRRIPTVNRAQFTSIFDDDNYKSALKNADSYQRIIYEEEAKAINEIQKGILAISQKEEPFDVFICYKESDANGQRTRDSVLAQELYYQLKQEGFKVFFARITLEDKLGSAYEPYIFAALNSAKVMVVLGTKPEYFNAVWVKNEWSRFLSLIKHGEKKMLIPAYKDMDPYNLPKEFSHLQAQDMSKLGFMQDLIRGIKKILGKDKKPAPTVTERVVVQGETHHDTAPLLRRAFLFLEDGNFDSADEYAEKVLDINPECAEAYVAKLLIELKLRKPTDLAQYKAPITESHNYQKALRFASPEYRATVEGYNNAIVKRLDTEHKERLYTTGLALMRVGKHNDAINSFRQVISYKDSAAKIEECNKAILEGSYSQATQLLESGQFDEAAKRFTSLADYKDAKEKVKLCAEMKETDRKDKVYIHAMRLLSANMYDDAAKQFASIADYKDSNEKIKLCSEKKETARKDAIYSQAMQRVLSKNADNVAMKKSIEELHTISGYRDVDDQIRTLDQRLEKWYEDKRIAEERAQERAAALRRERERKAEIKRIKLDKAKKIAKKVAIISAISIVSVTVLLVLLFTLVIPLIRYNKADKLFNAGKYDEAMQIYGDLNDFSDSEQRIAVLNGIGKIDEASFEEGIKTILAAGVPVKLTYGMGGGDFSGEEHISLPGKPNTINLSVSGATNVVPLTETDSVPETAEFTYNSSADFAGIQTPGRSGYRFVQWELESYNYQIEGTFEIKLNAVWSTKDYTVSYDLAGGKVNGSNVVEYDPEDEAFTLINPTRTGYIFTGWIGTDLSEPTIEVTIPTGSYGNRTYIATWKANEYTISYDAAGGSVSSEMQVVTFDSEVEFLIPERLGYTFLGWYEGETKHENGTWTRTSDLSLVAKWEVIEYEIRYDMDGGTNSPENPVKYTVDDQISLTPPQKTGYTFLGWTYMGQSTPVTDIAIPVGTIGEQRYTANWQANTYTVTFDANGGTVSESQMTVTYDEGYTLPVPTWEGHSFSGWYANGQKISDGTCAFVNDMALVAQWDVIDYTVSYEMNGGTNHSGNPNEYNYYTSFTLFDPTRTGYTFMGWTYEGQETPIKDITVDEGTVGDKKYTAEWEANTYTITFDPAGGLGAPESLEVTFDSAFSLPVPTKTGYTFDGWYTTLLSIYLSKFTDGTWTRTSDLSLKAKWQVINYTISYNMNGGTNASSNPVQYTINDKITLAEPTRTGYTFLGWTCEGQTEPTKDVSIALGTTGDKEYTAHWQVNTYTVTLDSNGGTVSPETLEATYDTVVTLPNPTKEGSNFIGWFVGGQQYTSGTWLTDSDITLVAKWSTNSYTVTYDDVALEKNSITVTFDHNDGEATTSTVTLTNGQILPYPTNPTRSGYVFTGWYTDSSFTTLYDFSGTITEDMVLYAGWSTCTITNDYYYAWSSLDGILTSTNKYNNTNSTYKITATMPVTISFSYKTSSESGYDYLFIQKNGSILERCSGSTSYVAYSVTLNTGDCLEFKYSKDSMYSYESDCAYIKDLTYTSNVSYTSTATASLGDGAGLIYNTASNHTVTVVFGENHDLLLPSRTGYTFDGWYYGETKVESGNWSIASDVTLTAKWVKNQYTVTFDANGGTGVDVSQTVTYESEYTLPTPTRTGYTFDGWFFDETQYTDGTWLTLNDITLVAKWIPKTDISYVVNHYQQNANDDEYTLESSLNLTGTADATITPTVKSFTHFVSPAAQTVTISPDGSLVVNYYYDRFTYDLTYVTNGGDTIEKQTYKYDQTLVIATPTRSGYTFGGWFTDATLSTEYSATATLNEDTTIYAYWTEENKPTDFTYSGTDSITVSAYSGTNTTMWIPAYIGGVPVTTIPASAFKDQTTLVKVVVPNTLTSWGYGVFAGCSSIVELTIPYVGHNTDSQVDHNALDSWFATSSSSTYYNTHVPTSLKTVNITVQTKIPAAAFYDCKYIEEINIPENVDSIRYSAFKGCSSLIRLNSTVDGVLNVPNKVTLIESTMFENCVLAEYINIGESVTEIQGGAFSGCVSLVMFTIPESVESIGREVFSGCISIAKINSENEGELNLPEAVTSVGVGAFKGLAAIIKVYIPSGAEMGYGIFEGCTSLEELTIPSVGRQTDASSATQYKVFDSLFVPSSSASSSNSHVPASIRKVTITAQTVIPEYAFSGCKYIEEINIPEATTSIGSYAFYGCCALLRLNSEVDGEFNIPDGITEIQAYTFYNCLLAENINIGDAVTSIGQYAFAECKMLTDFTIPETVTTIYNYAFSGCVSIAKINSENEGELNLPEAVTSVGAGAFKGLAAIIKVYIPGGAEMDYGIFEGCTSLEELTIPSVGRRTDASSSTQYKVFDSLFVSSSSASSSNSHVPASIRKVTITAQTVIPENAFGNCKYIEEINIPENTTSIGHHAFYGCCALLRLNSEVDGEFNIPDGITEIQEYTFYNCLLAEVINIGNAIININNYAFANCTSIKQFNSADEGELVIPTSVRVIGVYAFNGLTSITKVLIPDSVSAINANAFRGCTSLEEIVLPFIGRKVEETDAYYMVFGAIFGYNAGSISNHPYRNYDIPQSIKKVTITAQTIIPEYAFRNCDFIESIILPSTVTSVGENSFYNCTATVSYIYTATTSIWNGTYVSSSFLGSGTETDPYQINSAADFAYLASTVNAGENYAGKYFLLNTNINLNTKSWTPIGTKNKPFAGTFDGNGKKIYNLSVTMDTAYAGLFGYVSGTVKNLGVFSGTLAPASKAGTTYVGPLVAYLTGTVENCYSQAAVNVSITNIIYAGGLIGHVDTAATVKDSYASGHISAVSSSGFAYAGGFVGGNKGTIQNSLAFGNVTAKGSNDTYSRNGGFVANNSGVLTHCYRSETQVLTKYTTVGSTYCEDSSVDSHADMIAFAQYAWDSTVWEYTLKFPTFK